MTDLAEIESLDRIAKALELHARSVGAGVHDIDLHHEFGKAWNVRLYTDGMPDCFDAGDEGIAFGARYIVRPDLLLVDSAPSGAAAVKALMAALNMWGTKYGRLPV